VEYSTAAAPGFDNSLVPEGWDSYGYITIYRDLGIRFEE